MLAHELARLLLEFDNLPIATHANNHTYMSKTDSCSHGNLKIGRLKTYGGDHIVIGNISKKNINKPNWYISDMIHGNAPDEW